MQSCQGRLRTVSAVEGPSRGFYARMLQLTIIHVLRLAILRNDEIILIDGVCSRAVWARCQPALAGSVPVRMYLMKKFPFLLTLLALLAAACGTSEPVSIPSVSASPSRLPLVTGTSTLTPTPSLPTLTATPILIDGTLTIKVNVRSGPGTGYTSLGQLDAGAKVQVVARNSQGAWYQILYPAAPQGRGWVAAQYVTVAAGAVIPLDATPTLSGPTGRLIQRLNVRSGPATTFDSLGMLEPGVVVSLTGKNTLASWYQIVYPAGPGGRGWVTSQYVQTDVTDLPVLDDYGKVVTPGAAGTPSLPDVPPTPTIGPAIDDGDSSVNPAFRVTFSALGTTRLVYSSQVSAPQGDPQDWVEFTPYSAAGSNARLDLTLVCTGNGTLAVDLWQGGTRLSAWGSLSCGDLAKTILLPAGQVYQVSLSPVSGDGLRLISYTLTVQNDP